MIQYFLFKIMRFLVRSLRPRLAYGIGAVLAEGFYLLARANRNNLQANMRHVLAWQGEDVSSPPVRNKIRSLARKNFRNFAYYLIDFFRFSRFAREDIDSLLQLEGVKHFREFVAMGKGGIGVTAHLGNWELGGIVLGLLGFPVNAVALSHQNTRLNNLFTQQRALGGVKVIPVGRAAPMSLKALRRGEILLIVGDRDVTERGMHLEFFGRPALLPRGPAAFAVRTGAGILFGTLIRESTHRYVFTINPPIEADRSLPEAEQEEVIRRELVGQMEKAIAAHLDQWFVYYPIWPDSEDG